MAQVTVEINSREYAVACEDGEESRILQLARVLDARAKPFAGSGANEATILLMAGLLLADELSGGGKPELGIDVAAADRAIAESLAGVLRSVREFSKKIDGL